MADEPVKLFLSDCSEPLQKLTRLVAEQFQETVTWPSSDELHLLQQDVGVDSTDFSRHGRSIFRSVTEDGKQISQLNLWAMYDTGLFKRLFTEGRQILDRAFKDIATTRKAVTLTKGDIARRLRRSESDRYLVEVEYLFSRSYFGHQSHPDHGWQLVVDVLRSIRPTPTVEELFLDRPIREWPGNTTRYLSSTVFVDARGEGSGAEKNRKVFIVHGHDDGTKNTVARFVEQLELTPIILHEQASQGLTIPEKLEKHDDVGFAIVLLTPDDSGKRKADGSRPRDRARQNVVLELGYFWGALGRDKVCALVKGKIEHPSDYQGVVYVQLDDAGAWKLSLVKELRAAGYEIDVNAVLDLH